MLVVLTAAAIAAEQPRIVYSKAFPGSQPAYVEIEIGKDGAAIYKEDPKDEAPVKFELAAESVAEIFSLIEKLDWFKRPLESGLKVANMGKKTYRFVNGQENHQVAYNYSQDENARLLQDWFERITETQQHYFELERTVRFDKLGVNHSLLKLQTSIDRNRIVGRERFLPLLDRVTKNESYLHMARERAAGLADAIRNPKPKVSE